MKVNTWQYGNDAAEEHKSVSTFVGRCMDTGSGDIYMQVTTRDIGSNIAGLTMTVNEAMVLIAELKAAIGIR